MCHAADETQGPQQITTVTGEHDPGEQMLFLTVPAGALPLFSTEARKQLGKRVQQMPAGPNEPRRYHLHPLKGTAERVVVYENEVGGANGKPGLQSDDALLSGPIPGVFASIGALLLQILPIGDSTIGEAWEVVVIDEELAADIAADLAASYDPETEDGIPPEPEITVEIDRNFDGGLDLPAERDAAVDEEELGLQ